MIELILWFSKEHGEKKNWIIAKLSKDYRNEIKKQQMYELKWYIKGKSSSEEKNFNLLLHQTLFSG